jgi:uncharacterized protein YcaQ
VWRIRPRPPSNSAAGGQGSRKRRDPRWLILANQNVRKPGQCHEAFERLLDVAERVANRHNLVMDLEEARNGFRTMLRRRAEAMGQAPDLSLMGHAPLA